MKKLEHDEIPRLGLDEVRDTVRHPISILLEDVRSVHNVGSIIRTADAVLVQEVILAGVTAAGSHRGIHKSALGAQDSVPWRHTDNALREIDLARENGFTIIALEITDQPTDLAEHSAEIFPILLVVGNEVSGISESVLSQCDYAMELPQFGIKQSLNVSVATGIALYDLMRLYLAGGDGRR